MNCEEFEAIGLDAERDATLSEARARRRVSIRALVRGARHCRTPGGPLELSCARSRRYGMAQAPARVEMRLRQEFRTQHVTRRVRRAAVAVGWFWPLPPCWPAR